MRKINAIYRITDWLHYLGFALVGFTLKISRIDAVNFKLFFLILFFSSLLLAYAYSLNDYFDEGKNKKYFLLPLVFSLILLPFLNPNQIIWAIIFLVFFTLYSVKEISLSRLPVAGTLVNTFGFLSIFMIGYMTKEGIAVLGIVFFILLAIYQTVAQLIHEKVHLEEDTAAGRKTSVFYLKEKLTFLLRIMLLLTIPLALFLLLKTNFVLFAIACILFSLVFFVKADKVDRELRKRYKLVGMAAGIFFLLDYFFNISSIL